MIKVLTVIGTRPEAIKLAPVLRELERRPRVFDSRVCVTAQHREMVDQMLDLFSIEPDYDLDIMRPGQSLTDITREVLGGMEEILLEERPDWLVVQGDTTTVAASSLAGFYHNVRVAHVEAGLRTYDRHSPFPEEVNRRLAAVLADLHFAPTRWAADNLLREGIPAEAIRIAGNTVIDALVEVSTMPFDPLDSGMPELPIDDKRLVMVTAHRGENFGEGIERICHGLKTLARQHDDLHLVFPVHMNPRVREPVYRHLGRMHNITLLDPLDYQSTVWLLSRCHFVITDSGGLQEEAAGVGKPVLVLRDSTERPEAVEAGTAKLIGSDGDRLVSWASRLLGEDGTYDQMARAISPYGNGTAAVEIVESLRLGRAHVGAPPAPQPHDALLETDEGSAALASMLRRRFHRRTPAKDGVAA